MGQLRILLADDHTVEPDVVVLDVAMPLLNGIEATRQILERSPATRILVLTMHADEQYVNQVLKAGATGYLLQDSADVDLIEAVGAVSKGKSFFGPGVARLMPNASVRHDADKGITDRFESLSKREREIFQLVAEGKSNKQIAALLAISPSTVETHRARIMEKIGVHSAADIVFYAVRRGVIHQGVPS